jgi:hypothetical protein
MLQRLQHLYLLLVVLICALLLGSDQTYFIITSADGTSSVEVGYLKTQIQSAEQSESLLNLPLVFSFGALAVIALLTVFLYQNRKLQLRLTGFAMLLLGLGVYALYAYSLQRAYFNPAGTTAFQATVYVPIAILLLLLLAYRGILNDEKLIRSMDRLR